MMNRRDFLTAGSGLGASAALWGGVGLSLVPGVAAAAQAGVSLSTFAALLNQDFRVYPGLHGVVLTLLRVTDVSAHFKGGAQQFRLVFSGRAADGLPAGLYEMENAATGSFQIYLQTAESANPALVLYRAEFSLLS